jgi:hypothetical protein
VKNKKFTPKRIQFIIMYICLMSLPSAIYQAPIPLRQYAHKAYFASTCVAALRVAETPARKITPSIRNKFFKTFNP